MVSWTKAVALATWRSRVNTLLGQAEQSARRGRPSRNLPSALKKCCSLIYGTYDEVYDDGLGSSEEFCTPPDIYKFSKPKLPLTFVQISSTDQLDEQTVLTAALYVNQPVFVLDLAISENDAYGFWKLVEANTRLKSFGPSFSMPVLPQRITRYLTPGFSMGSSSPSTRARVMRPPAELPPDSIYSALGISRQVSLDSLRGLPPLILPYFKGIDPRLLGKIKEDETDAFARFQAHLRASIVKIAQTDQMSVVSEEFAQLTEESAKLHLEAKKILRLQALRNISMGAAGLSIAAVINPDLVSSHFTGIVGSVSLISAITSHVTLENAIDSMRQSAFYIPFIAGRRRTGSGGP